MPTQAVRHICSRNLGIVKIFKIAPHKQKSIVKTFFGRKMGPLDNGALCLSHTPEHNGKSGTGRSITNIYFY